jgi:hypothetical protein
MWETLKNKLPSDHNFYSNVLIGKMNFPAIILTPSSQTPDIELASYKNRILEYNWSLIILDRIENHDDDIDETMDEMWTLAETIPDLLGIKIIESVPFGHLKDNKELFCIEFKCKSKLK